MHLICLNILSYSLAIFDQIIKDTQAGDIRMAFETVIVESPSFDDVYCFIEWRNQLTATSAVDWIRGAKVLTFAFFLEEDRVKRCGSGRFLRIRLWILRNPFDARWQWASNQSRAFGEFK